MGEAYAALLLGGEIVTDDLEYDVVAGERRIAVKARRKTSGSGWTSTGDIPRVEGEDIPTHLKFLQFSENYALEDTWLFPWEYLARAGRLKEKWVRGQLRSHIIRIAPTKDTRWLWTSDAAWTAANAAWPDDLFPA